MSKRELSIIVATAGLITSVACAEPYSFLPNPSAPPPSQILMGQPTPALSANDFKNQVTVNAKKAQRELFQNTYGDFKQQTSQMPLPNKPPKPPNNLGRQSNSALPPPPAEALPPAETNESTSTARPIPSTPPTPTTEAPVQSQVYTGFGGASPNPPTPPTPPPSNSNGGWNIKY